MKQYRILRISRLLYPNLITLAENQIAQGSAQDYASMQAAIFAQRFIYSDSFADGMRRIGHEAEEIVYDLETVQKRWALENGVVYDPGNWAIDITLAQIERIKPDVLFFQDVFSLPIEIRRRLKSLFPFLKLIVVFKGFPADFDRLDADILLTCTPTLIGQFRAHGLAPRLWYHSFDDRLPAEIGPVAVDVPFSFAGGMSGFDSNNQEYVSRYWELVELFRRTPLEAWLDEKSADWGPSAEAASRLPPERGIRRLPQVLRERYIRPGGLLEWLAYRLKFLARIYPPAEQFVSGLINRLFYDRFVPRVAVFRGIREYFQGNARLDTLKRRFDMRYSVPLRLVVPDRAHGSVWGRDMYAVLARSKITFNRHTDSAGPSVGNLRMFHAGGMGACLVTDTGDNMADLFEPDSECVTYRSLDECIEKVNYLLGHENERAAIARAGQKRVLERHTAVVRCAELDEMIQKLL